MRQNPQLQFSEQEYWERIKQGDHKAYEEIFRAWYKPLCLYGKQFLKDMDEAEEVVQNVYYNLWSRRADLNVSSSLKAYLYRAVHNDSLNRLKHLKVKRAHASEFVSTAETFSAPAEDLSAREAGREIGRAIQDLPDQCRLVFSLSRFEGKKYAEIAQELDISVKTVENHMGKALRLLRERLKDFITLLIICLIIIYR